MCVRPALLCRSDKATPHKGTKPQTGAGAAARAHPTTLASAPAPAAAATLPTGGVGLLAGLTRSSPLPTDVRDDFSRTATPPCHGDLVASRHRMATITRHTPDRWEAARQLIQLMDLDMLAAREYSANQRRSVFRTLAGSLPWPGQLCSPRPPRFQLRATDLRPWQLPAIRRGVGCVCQPNSL